MCNPSNDEYVVELLNRAIMCVDQNARIKVQQCLCGVVHSWLHHHADREVLCRLDNEENYVDVAFERFWQVTIGRQIEFNILATALRYLCVCLNGAILDRLRASLQPEEVILAWSGLQGEPVFEDVISSAEVWERVQKERFNVREQRLAYLLFHCGFKPGEIVHCCPQEFSDMCEIYRLRRNIIERILRNVDHLQ